MDENLCIASNLSEIKKNCLIKKRYLINEKFVYWTDIFFKELYTLKSNISIIFLVEFECTICLRFRTHHYSDLLNSLVKSNQKSALIWRICIFRSVRWMINWIITSLIWWWIWYHEQAGYWVIHEAYVNYCCTYNYWRMLCGVMLYWWQIFRYTGWPKFLIICFAHDWMLWDQQILRFLSSIILISTYFEKFRTENI